MDEARAELASPSAAPSEGIVPWSSRAALLAGLGATFLQAGLVVVEAQRLEPGLAGLSGVNGGSVTAVLIASGLWSGARAAASTLLLTHFSLRFVDLTSPIAYALGGAVMGAGSAYLLALLGLDSASLASEAATGLAAGYLYRTFAGLRAK